MLPQLKMYKRLSCVLKDYTLHPEVKATQKILSIFIFSPPKQAIKSYFEQKYQDNIRPTRASLKSQNQAGKFVKRSINQSEI